MNETLAMIAARRREIETELARLSAQMDALKAELPDLEAAERVFGRFAGGRGGNAQSATQSDARLDASKPPNTPTIADMIVTALLDARQRGLAGLEPKGMTDYIAKRWWPNVPGVAISPIAWRMWKVQNKLDKHGTLYALPKNTEAADLLSPAGSAASRSNHQH
jgi:hypothetical protein